MNDRADNKKIRMNKHTKIRNRSKSIEISKNVNTDNKFLYIKRNSASLSIIKLSGGVLIKYKPIPFNHENN